MARRSRKRRRRPRARSAAHPRGSDASSDVALEELKALAEPEYAFRLLINLVSENVTLVMTETENGKTSTASKANPRRLIRVP